MAEKGSAALRLAVVLSHGTFQRHARGVMVFSFDRDGDSYQVLGLRGHIVELDYPEALHDWDLGTLDALVEATPLERVSEPAIGETIRALAADVDEAWVCTDFDREGELIGVEALRIAREARPGLPAKRARFSALTRIEIEEAFAHPVEVDERLAAAARAREEIDLAWGAVLSRFLSLACGLHGRDFLSAGRVQTPTLALLVDREREVEEFVPRPYWSVTALLGPYPGFPALHMACPLSQRDQADAIHGRAELATEAAVRSYRSEIVQGKRPPPFNTTSFVAEATRLGLSAAKVMAVAESLYQSGLLSYPRTDNTAYPPSLSLRSALERLRESDLAPEVEEVLAQATIHPSRGAIISTDHPPIYPTASARRDDLKEDHWKIWELAARRFLATLAPPATLEDSEAEFDLAGEPFVARGRRLVEPGWRRYYGPLFVGTPVPPVAAGEWVPVVSVTQEARETQPPPAYSQGYLIQAMEENHLGTKSTRHEILQKLYDRGYIEGRRIHVTAAGRVVVEALEAYGGHVARPEMTAVLEQALDAIARGERTAADVVEESRALLRAVLGSMRAHEGGISEWVRTAIANEKEVGTCELCGGTMLIRRMHNGRRFVGCSNYPNCKNSKGVGTVGLVLPSGEICGRCGSRLLTRVHRGISDHVCVTPECVDEELTKAFGV